MRCDVMGEGNILVICQKWEESEAGWGTRPDGYSLHLSLEHLKQYIAEYWEKMPDEVPDEYCRPGGAPYECEIDSETYLKLKASKNGLRFWDTPPYPGGIDGWIPKYDSR